MTLDMICTKDPPCKFCGFCIDCSEIHEENSWKRYFGEYFNSSRFWREDLRDEAEMMSRFPWHLKMRRRCKTSASTCLFCGICIGCGEEYYEKSLWRKWGRYFN